MLNRIFSTRTLGLFDQFGAAALPSYLSGLLIGAEIGGATAARDNTSGMRDAHSGQIMLLGSHPLTAR